MKGFGIEIKNTLIEPRHIETMGMALWLYLWMLDKVTVINDAGEGLVLGGKPIVYKNDIEAEFGIHQNTYTDWLDKLESGGYVKIIRTPHGLSFRVQKVHKRFGKRFTHKGDGDSQEPVRGLTEKGECNIRHNKDITIDSSARAKAPADSPTKKRQKKDPDEPMTLAQFIEGCRASPQKHINIIGEYADEKKPDFHTRGQWNAFLKRNFRAASDLSPYTKQQIAKAMRKLKDASKEGGYLSRWTLETLIKYLD